VGTYVTEAGDRFTIMRDSDGLEITADGQAATNCLDGSSDADAALYAADNARSAAVLKDLMANDESSLTAAGGSPSFNAAAPAELKNLAKGPGDFQGLRVAGTYHGGFPASIRNTVVRLDYSRGSA
jgi:hypothetical protein